MSSSLSDFVLSIRLFIFSSSLSTRSVIHDYGDNLQHSAGKVNSNNNGALCIQQWGEAAVLFHGLGFRSQKWVLTYSSH
jgi:predicted membrane protein